MVREELIEALRVSLRKGESLRQGIESLYNAGYEKEDVDQAVQALKTQPIIQPIQPKPIPKPAQPIQKPVLKKVLPLKPIKVPQRVSAYEQPKKIQPIQKPVPQKIQTPPQTGQQNKSTIIVLVIVLFVLLGILVTLFLFKAEIIDFLNRLLG